MNNPTPSPSNSAGDSTLESEVLISRIMDGEADDNDRRRFELLANANEALWRDLALRQQDKFALESHVGGILQAADMVELPESRRPVLQRRPWLAAFSGWAAALALAGAWSAVFLMGNKSTSPQAIPVMQNQAAATVQTPDEHLRQYMDAPFVLGELPPTMLQAEALSDGRVALRLLRRIEEVAFIDPGVELPVDSDGNLLKPPSELRSTASPE